MIRLTKILRAGDVRTRRAVRNAHLAICSLPAKLAMHFTRMAAALPTSREVQDGAMYACAFVTVVLLLSGVLS